jgi:hypothetical protein
MRIRIQDVEKGWKFTCKHDLNNTGMKEQYKREKKIVLLSGQNKSNSKLNEAWINILTFLQTT